VPTDYWLVNNAKVFAAYAGRDARRWRTAVGCRIDHVSLGSGTIVDTAEADTVECVTVMVQFDRGVGKLKQFSPRHFLKANLFSDLAIPKPIFGLTPGQSQRLDVASFTTRPQTFHRRMDTWPAPATLSTITSDVLPRDHHLRVFHVELRED